jgi:hypothetical protein
LSLALCAGAAAVLLAAGTASAGGGKNKHSFFSAGALDATGDGIAAAAGKLEVRACAEDGLLLAKGNVDAGDATFSDEVSWLGLHVFFDFAGCAAVSAGGDEGHVDALGGGKRRHSERVAVLVVGTGLELHAAGNGIALLKGSGTWEDSNGESGEWTEEGEILRIGGAKEEKPECDNDGAGAQHYGKKKDRCETPEEECPGAQAMGGDKDDDCDEEEEEDCPADSQHMSVQQDDDCEEEDEEEEGDQ